MAEYNNTFTRTGSQIIDTPRATTLQVVEYVGICLLSLVSFITAHELVHLLIGQVVGLPTHFITATSVGVSQDVVDASSQLSLALMNGIAPIFSSVVGFVALYYLPMLRRRHATPGMLRIATWWAIFGVPYLGLQLMVISSPVSFRGDGADSAALAGFFDLSRTACAGITVIGVILYLSSGFLLCDALAGPRTFFRRGRPAELLTTLTSWRKVILGIFVVAIPTMTGVAVAQIIAGSSDAYNWVLLGVPVLWLILTALMIPWEHDDPADLRSEWIIPSLLLGVAFFVLNLYFHLGDYSDVLILILPPVITAVWASS